MKALGQAALALTVRRRWVGAIGLGAAAVATTSVFACRHPASPGVNACALPYGDDACASCVATSCCSESSACAADPVCSSFEACLGNSDGDWQARSQCAVDHPVGSSAEVSPLSACLATHCTDECNLTCGGLAANFTEPTTASMCQQCVAGSSFCASEQACASSEACDALARCELGCETLDCQAGCLSADDAGAGLFASFLGAFRGACSAPCAYGQDWSCVGHVSWPATSSDTTTFTVDVQDYATLAAVSGADVSVCDRTDVNCNRPLANAVTDSQGSVVMQVPNQAQVGGLGLNGYLQITSPSTVPEVWYWGFPLSESALTLRYNAFFESGVRLLTPGELQALAASLDVALDPTLGIVVVMVSDCALHAAPDVRVIGGVRAIYGQSATATATDGTGLVTFFNVPIGNVDLTAVPLALGGKPSSHVTVIVRAGWMTTVLLVPTP